MIDSLEKIVRFFVALTKEPFEYNGGRFEPKALVVQPSVVNGLVCPPECGACCRKSPLYFCSSDFVPVNRYEPPDPVIESSQLDCYHTINMTGYCGYSLDLSVDFQNDNQTKTCRWLGQSGRCQIHGVHPLICDLEPIRVYLGTSVNYNEIRTARYSSKVLIRQIHGNPGARCEFTMPTDQSVSKTVRTFVRLNNWANYLGLSSTWVPEIIDYLLSGKWREGPLVLPKSATLTPRATKYPGRDLLKILVAEERYTRKEIFEKLLEAHPEVPKSYYDTLLSDCKNPAYNPLHRLVVAEEGVYRYKRPEPGELDLTHEKQAVEELIWQGLWKMNEIIAEVMRRFPGVDRSTLSQLMSDRNLRNLRAK